MDTGETAKDLKIAVAGTGYVGMSIATLLSQHHQVTAVDVIAEKVEKINNRISPIQDEYIEKYLAEKELNLRATLDGKEAYRDADFVVIAAPTNYDPVKNYFDTSHVEEVIDLVLEVNPDAVMVIKSTIPVGYTRSLYLKYYNKGVKKLNLLFSPEFLRESKALYDNLYPSRIIVAIANATTPWKAGTKVSANTIKQQGIEKFFAIDTISNEVYHRMANKSLPKNNHISRHDLRYLRLLHYDIQGNILRGEMVCNKAIAHDLVEIFRTLFESRYPIERMQLIDDYAANDELSMSHNNTSCFCYRPVAGSRTLSRHSYGMAVDINPFYNPCVKIRKGKRIVQPASAIKWADRTKSSRYTLSPNDLCYRLFIKHGFRWGGAWRTTKDYQHFEK